jgi:XTP/dITP diphosphohydrolase
MKLLIATRNRHKLDEIRAILSVPGLELLAAGDLPGMPDVEEDGATFPENAAKKARQLCDASGLWTLGDDSGLEVDALDGAPGVLSARYAGAHGDDAGNNRKLLADLEGVADRGAQFRCAVALAAPDGRTWGVDGVCRGHLLTAPRGTGGFGYDPLFVPDGHTQTFAELSGPQKNRISHRARALAAARAAWAELLA